MIAEILSPERSAEGLFPYIISQAERTALSHIEVNFERNPDPMGNLPYHDRLHTLRVRRRGAQIYQRANLAVPGLVTPKDLIRIQIGALFHDPIQKWEEKDGRRRRFTGKNEEESADMAVSFMNRMNEEHGVIFTLDDKEIVRDEILTTTPGFKDGTVIQPLLRPGSHFDTKDIAVSDVDGCLIDGPRIFLGEGDALFREENLDILRALRDKGVGNLSVLQMEEFRARMLGWVRSQIKFVEGRQALVDSDLAGLPEPAIKAVKGLLDKGEDSKRELGKLIVIRENLSFPELVASFGYTQFHS